MDAQYLENSIHCFSLLLAVLHHSLHHLPKAKVEELYRNKKQHTNTFVSRQLLNSVNNQILLFYINIKVDNIRNMSFSHC